jgi:hypothetical protein
MLGPEDNDLKSISDFNSRLADRLALLILAGLTVDIAAVFVLGKSWLEYILTIGANALIFFGVWGELYFAKRAREADDGRVAEANARAAEAQLETERLRAANLAVQKLLTPRRITLMPKDENEAPLRRALLNTMEKFAGTKALLQWIPDFEAKTLACDIADILVRVNWQVEAIGESSPIVSPGLIREGVYLLTQEGPLWERTESGTLQRVQNRKMSVAYHAAMALKAFLKLGFGELASSWEITYSSEYPDVPSILSMKFEIPEDSVLVLVGARPISAVLNELAYEREKQNPK